MHCSERSLRAIHRPQNKQNSFVVRTAFLYIAVTSGSSTFEGLLLLLLLMFMQISLPEFRCYHFFGLLRSSSTSKWTKSNAGTLWFLLNFLCALPYAVDGGDV